MDTHPHEAPTGAQPLSRRAFLRLSAASVAAIAVLDPLAAFAAPSRRTELDGFVQLSRIVTGVRHLPAGLAPRYLDALDRAGLPITASKFVRLAGFATESAPASLVDLERSAAFHRPGARRTVEAVASAWWSGVVPLEDGGQKVVTYQDALVWKALPYAEPPSICLGATTAWSEPGRKLS
jgi:hypothetical protein